MADSWPEPEEILPHGAAILFLQRILHADEDRLRGVGRLPHGSVFVGNRSAPSTLGIELAAQAAAAHEGLRRGRTEWKRMDGYLIGARDVELVAPELPAEKDLEVEVYKQRSLPPLHYYGFQVQHAGRRMLAGTLSTLFPGESPHPWHGETAERGRQAAP